MKNNTNSGEQVYGGARSIADVRKVIDCGNFYYLVVGGKVSSYICQKNPLVEGTLAEFENLFEENIVCKDLTKK